MKFQFHISLNDNDYLAYNKFHMLRSPYGAKSIKTFRATLVALFVLIAAVSLAGGGFTKDTLICIIPCGVLLLISQLLLTRLLALSLKGQIAKQKKTGKPGYAPSSVMEFYEDHFVEITDQNKTEQSYAAIERVSVVDGEMVYIHLNFVMACLLPVSAFESEKQYNDFLNFLHTKCPAFDVYVPKK